MRSLGTPQVQRTRLGNIPLGLNRGGSVTDTLGRRFVRVTRGHAESRWSKLGSEVIQPADCIRLDFDDGKRNAGGGLRMEGCRVLDDGGLTAFYLASLGYGDLKVSICPQPAFNVHQYVQTSRLLV